MTTDNSHLANIARIRKNLNRVAKALGVNKFSVRCGRGTARGWCDISRADHECFDMRQTVLLESIGIGGCSNNAGLDYCETQAWGHNPFDLDTIRPKFEALLADHCTRPEYRPAWPQPTDAERDACNEAIAEQAEPEQADTCPHCMGTGDDITTKFGNCEHCMGTGEQAEPEQADTCQPVAGAIVVAESGTLPDGTACIAVDCANLDAFNALPAAVDYNGRRLGRSGWNSDRACAYYRSDVAAAVAAC